MNTFSISTKARIFAYPEPVHMTAGFPKLTSMVDTHWKQKGGRAQTGDLFLFVNKKRNYLKVLWYHRDGFCLFSKKLVTGTFEHSFETKKETFTLAELQRLVDHVAALKKIRRVA